MNPVDTTQFHLDLQAADQAVTEAQLVRQRHRFRKSPSRREALQRALGVLQEHSRVLTTRYRYAIRAPRNRPEAAHPMSPQFRATLARLRVERKKLTKMLGAAA